MADGNVFDLIDYLEKNQNANGCSLLIRKLKDIDGYKSRRGIQIYLTPMRKRMKLPI